MPNKLEVSLQLVDKLTAPLNRAAQDINGITRRIEGAFKFVTAATAVTGLAVGIGAAVSKSIEFGDHIDDLSKKLNISAESVQLWDVVLKNNNSSLDAAAGGFQNLNAMAYSAAIGQKKSAILFQQLGVDVKDANGALRSQNDILNDTIYKLADLKDATLQSALAQKLGLTEMLPVIRQGSQAIKDQIEQAREYGIVSGTTVEKLAQAKDNMDHFHRSTAALSAEFTATFIPAIGAGAEALAKVIANIGKFLNSPEKDSGKKNVLKGLQEDAKNLRWEIDLLEQAGKSGVKNGFADPERLRVARVELRLIEDDIKRINGEINKTPTHGTGLKNLNSGKESEDSAKRELATWVKISKEINNIVAEENYAETKALWEARNNLKDLSLNQDVELPEYLKENSPLTKAILDRKEIIVRSNEEIAQSYIDSGMRISSAIGTMVSLQNNMTENRIARMKAEGTLTKENEKDFRDQMRRRQGVLAAIAIAEAAAAAVSSVYKAWKDGGSWYEALAKSIAGGLEVAAVTATQVASIKAASFASGGRTNGGWIDVGEQGRERLYLPPSQPGYAIMNAHETNRMQNQPSKNFYLTINDGEGQMVRQFERGIRSGEFDTAIRMLERKMGVV